MDLLIVESPTKAKKIQPMLGNDWRVLASAGHIRDLPLRELGVTPGTYQLQYEIIEKKRDVVERLRSAARTAGEVYIATDPDREGEAIAWHIQQVLGLREPKRVTFHEITKSAVLAAIADAHEIDVDRVYAQEGRRALDRLVGYRVSGALRQRTGRPLSAGRVQTVAVLLIVDREAEIEGFTAQAHYAVILTFDGDGKPWTAEWNFRPLLPADQKLWTDKATAERVAGMRDVKVLSCEETVANVAPPAPFTTTTMQQAASLALHLKVAKTMDLAQALFQKGHITYHRTDDPNFAPEAIETIRMYASQHGFALPEKPRHFKAKEGAQEGHEAIRPTHIELEDARATAELPASEEEQRLYELIRNRAIASQLADAQYDVRTATLESVDRAGGAPVEFVAKGRTLRVPGFKALVSEDQAEEKSDEPEAKNPVPQLAVDSILHAAGGVAESRKTKPPQRYSEAALVKALESKGIGRPSTYAAILANIQMREYVLEHKDRKFRPTELGVALIGATRDHFSFVNVQFTRKLETQLDEIAQRKMRYVDVVSAQDGVLERELAAFSSATSDALGPLAGPPCPRCEVGMLYRRARKAEGKKKAGFFWSCNRYPDCQGAFDDRDGEPDLTPKAPVPQMGDPGAIACPVCAKGVLIRREGQYGPWWGCSAFKDGCKARFKDDAGNPDFTPPKARVEGGKCPKCSKGTLVQRESRKGPFWGCDRYPKCKETREDAGGMPAA